MIQERTTVRFGVGTQQGTRGHVWLLFTSKSKSDVYITGYGFRQVFKVSLHESGKWRQAYTQEYASRSPSFVSADTDRVMERWERPSEFASGVTKALEIMVPASEVTIPKYPEVKPGWADKYVLWFPPPPQDFATFFTVIFTDPHVSQNNLEITWRNEDGTLAYIARSIWHKKLPNGQSVWVVMHERQMSKQEKDHLQRHKEQWIAAVEEKMGNEAFSAMTDPRSYFAGFDADGTRFFMDVSTVLE